MIRFMGLFFFFFSLFRRFLFYFKHQVSFSAFGPTGNMEVSLAFSPLLSESTCTPIFYVHCFFNFYSYFSFIEVISSKFWTLWDGSLG